MPVERTQPPAPPAQIAPQKGYDTAPRLPKLFTVEYPERLHGSGIVGNVLVRVRVSSTGKIKDLAVLLSHHAAIEAAVVDKLLDVQMEPATRAGQPVEATVVLTIQFKYIQPPSRFYANDGVRPYAMPKSSDDRLPAMLQYDIPPKSVLATLPVYPHDLAQHGIEGSAQVAFIVGKTGRVTETHVIEASHPEFGLATAAMLESWAFKPARRNDQPTAAYFVKTQMFSGSDRDTALSDIDQNLLKRAGQPDANLFALRDLDQVPAVRYRVAPPYPRTLVQQSLQEAVTIEFILDTEGRVHLPRIIDAAHPEFGWSAATALARWRFEPPLRQGKPVAARLRIPFEFSPPKITQPAAAP
jgi:TonB family protein